METNRQYRNIYRDANSYNRNRYRNNNNSNNNTSTNNTRVNNNINNTNSTATNITKIISSGIVSRPSNTNILRCTFLNLTSTEQYFNFSLNDWTNNSSANLKSNDIYLGPNEGRILNLILKSPFVSENTFLNKVSYSPLLRLSSYSDVIDVEMYEVRVTFNNYTAQAVKINFSNIAVQE